MKKYEERPLLAGPESIKITQDTFSNFSPEAIVALHDLTADFLSRQAVRANQASERGKDGIAEEIMLNINKTAAFICCLTGIEMPALAPKYK